MGTGLAPHSADSLGRGAYLSALTELPERSIRLAIAALVPAVAAAGIAAALSREGTHSPVRLAVVVIEPSERQRSRFRSTARDLIARSILDGLSHLDTTRQARRRHVVRFRSIREAWARGVWQSRPLIWPTWRNGLSDPV